MKAKVFVKALLHLLLLLDVSAAAAFRGKAGSVVKAYKRAPLQDIVTWDEHSLFVHGQRVLFFSGEFHPFRLPVPDLWPDIFQKIRALGYNGVSFYTNWAQLEGQPGHFRANGIFALEPFFEAAKEAGIYLLARPGPYINAEVSGGGYPGWLQRLNGQLRTDDPAYLNATNLYVQSISKIIAKAQITNGGPVILFQPENEYTRGVHGVQFPNQNYFHDVEEQYRQAGIVVPFISNDASPDGYYAPGTGVGAADIYGHDSYPLGFDCAHPYTWPNGSLPTTWRTLHEEQSPNTPYSIVEFQGGSFDPWGGLGFDQCSFLLNNEFERVFYKNDYSFGVTIFNVYMTYGGTNWGGLSHPGGYTSYDYGAVITEDRSITREKYSEAKLEANFLMASPAYLTATPGNNTNANGSYTDSKALAVTPLFSGKTSFFVLRHAFFNSFDSTTYKLQIPTSVGNLSIPQMGGQLTLNGRDSKIHVADYEVGGFNLLYSSAEIFTWLASSTKTVLVVYGGPGEHHELAISGTYPTEMVEGSELQMKAVDGATILNWETSPHRRIVKVDNNLFVYVLDRNSAYNYWTTDISSEQGSKGKLLTLTGYLIRTAKCDGNHLALNGDYNATKPLEVIFGAPASLESLTFNNRSLEFSQDDQGAVKAVLEYTKPEVHLPSLEDLEWKYIDSLPELQEDYDDSGWTNADIVKTPNIANQNQSTPTSLFAGDYGYHMGNLLYRGHFVASGEESVFSVESQGGYAYAASAWINSTFLGSWPGVSGQANYSSTFKLSGLTANKAYVFTILLDNMGLDENQAAGDAGMKNPRGILKYNLAGREASCIQWKITGNLGGEEYRDLVRGPLNEGGLYAERQGFHQPKAPTSEWKIGKPTEGLNTAGVRFYYASFDLDLPLGYNIPISFLFANGTAEGSKASSYRSQLYVNGYQFGKYVHNIGPQDSFPVPAGILISHDTTYIGLSLWALDAEGAKLDGLKLQHTAVIESGFGLVRDVPMPAYSPRPGAY